MRSLGILLIALFISLTTLANGDDSRTFMVIFKQKELKSYKTSIQKIEAQFSSSFKTKSYSGNSDLTLVIEVPTKNIDACTLGDFLVELGENHEIKLQELAFRVFDLTEGQQELQSFLSHYEEMQQDKKNNKLAKLEIKE